MGEFSEWYSTFLTDLPGGGVPLHKKRPPARPEREAAGPRRLGTADYQAFIRDMHRVERDQRRKLHSLPELERSPSPSRRRRGATDVLASKSTVSLPVLWAGPSGTGKPSVKSCKTFLTQCINPRTRRQTAEVLVLDGLANTDSGTTSSAVGVGDRKVFVPKHIEYREVETDDLLSWQRGLLEKTAEGKPVLKQAELRAYDEDCIDVGLTLQKAKNMVKLLGIREQLAATAETVRASVQHAMEQGEIDSMSAHAHIRETPDFIWENRKDVLIQRKEIKRTKLVQACSKRAKQNLQVKERSIMNEVGWRLDVERKLEERHERQTKRIHQSRWLPVFFVAMATLRMQKTILVARRFRQRVAQDHESATILQRAWRVTKQRRAQLKVSVFTLRKIRFQVKCWARYIREKAKHKHVVVVRHVLQEYAQMRSIAMYVHKYRKNVVSCQRFIRAFNQANRARMKEMGKQWDQVARDIIGDDSGRMWMHRLLNQAKIDENGKAVNPANANQDLATFKESKLRLEIRRLRREFMDRYEQYKTDVRVFKAKVEMYSTMESMGLDAGLVRAKLGIASMVPKPKMESAVPRAVIRYSVEKAMKSLGILDFVDEMMLTEFKDRIDKLMDILCNKFMGMIRNNVRARDLFDEIDEDGSGTLEEEEVKAFLDRLEVKTNYQEVRVLFARLDYSGTGSLSFSEFLDRINNWKKHGKDMEKKRNAAKAKSKGSKAVDLDNLRSMTGLDETPPPSEGIGRTPSIGRTQSIKRTQSIRGGPNAIGRTPSVNRTMSGAAMKRAPSVKK